MTPDTRTAEEVRSDHQRMLKMAWFLRAQTRERPRIILSDDDLIDGYLEHVTTLRKMPGEPTSLIFKLIYYHVLRRRGLIPQLLKTVLRRN